MKKISALFLILSVPLAAAGWDPASAADRASLERFVAARVDKAGAPPFSFIYGGKPSKELLPKWKMTDGSEPAAGGAAKTVVYLDPATGLRLTAVYTTYADSPAVEWVLRFKNEGKADTPIIEDVQACAAELDGLPADSAVLYRALGSSGARTDFAPLQDSLGESAEVRFGPSAGRSSDTTALPFFNIAASGRGVMAAIGWSGKWKAVVKRTGARTVELRAGLDKTHFKLHPGEEVRSPSIALLFWTGRRPAGRSQPLPEVPPRPPHAAPRREAGRAAAEPRRRVRRAVPLQRIRLRHRKLRYRHDRPLETIRPQPGRLLDRRRLVRERHPDLVVGAWALGPSIKRISRAA